MTPPAATADCSDSLPPVRAGMTTASWYGQDGAAGDANDANAANGIAEHAHADTHADTHANQSDQPNVALPLDARWLAVMQAAACGNDDENHLRHALALASLGAFTTQPNPAVGCIIVQGGERVGEGWHAQAGQPHAEILALRQAGSRARRACMYVTLEPCCHEGRTAPCCDAIVRAGITRCVVATEDPNPQVCGGGLAALQRGGVEVVVLHQSRVADAARWLNRGFFTRMATGKPWVTVKIAASLDGKTAMASGESQWLTAPPARHDVHCMRATASAILTGIGSVLHDDPALTARLNGVTRQPMRVIIDTHLRTPPQAKILQATSRVLIFTAPTPTNPAEQPSHIECIAHPNDSPSSTNASTNAAAPSINLPAVLQELGARQVNHVVVEAGPTLNSSFLAQQLADELILYIAPHILGGQAQPMFHLDTITTLADKIRFVHTDTIRVGRDLKLTLSQATHAPTCSRVSSNT